MNSRERVKLALDHREPDRIPLDFGGTVLTSLTTRHASLEDVFVKLTGRHLDDKETTRP